MKKDEKPYIETDATPPPPKDDKAIARDYPPDAAPKVATATKGKLTVVDGNWIATGKTFPTPDGGEPFRFTDPENSAITYERVAEGLYRAVV